MEDELPMPTPTVPRKPFKEFKSMSFDIYETLIQWESSILEHLGPLVTKHAGDQSPYRHATTDPAARDKLAEVCAKHEKELQTESPSMKYGQILTQAYLRVAAEIGVSTDNEEVQSQARAFGTSVGDWPAFPDTVAAMKQLGKRYKLIALSNVDRESFARTNAGPLKGISFWRVFTAEDIGSYKPSLQNFEYLFKHLQEDDVLEGGKGIDKAENLHAAQSLFHDHIPAKTLGIGSVWINRKGAGTGKVGYREVHERGKVGYGWRFRSLGEFAEEVEKAWREVDG